jgi:magnesium transporter
VITTASHSLHDRRVTTTSAGRQVRSRLFDADRSDRILSFDDALSSKVSKRQLLWIDVEGDVDPDAWQGLVDRFKLPAETERALQEPERRPDVRLHQKHFSVRVAVEPDPAHPEQATWLDIVGGPNVVISRHSEPVALLEGLNARIATDATIGELDAAEFIAALLEAVVTSYHRAIDRLEDDLDELDARALGKGASDGLFQQLVGVRRRVGRLRRLLAAHRVVFEALQRPDFGRGIESKDAAVFKPAADRFESAIKSIESTREVVLASFEVLMTRTAERTNDIVRVLTLVTVLGLPATITAGFLGMNVIVPVSAEDPASFWVILSVVLVIELGLVSLARWRGWI